MKEKLKDARKDILTLTQLSILAALFSSAWIVQNIFPIKTLAAMVTIAISLFLLIAFLFLWGVKKEEKYSPIFPRPLDIIMLILAITVFSYFSLLIALQFTNSDDNAEFIFKSVLFGLSFLGFWCYRSTEKKQYLLYAIIYGLSVLASWVVESDDVLRSCSQIMSNVTNSIFPPEAIRIVIRVFAVPIREAMLLFTIWDNFPGKHDSTPNQKQAAPKTHYTRHKSNNQKRKKRKK